MGCVYCGERGFTGRLALFEMLTPDEGLAHLVTTDAGEGVIKEHLRSRG